MSTFQYLMEQKYGGFENFNYIVANKQSLNSRKAIHGHGLNDLEFMAKVQQGSTSKQKTYPLYRAWVNMLQRCYSDEYKNKKSTYINTTCCTEWLSCSKFCTDMVHLYKEGYHLDKDILLENNNIYSKEACIFVPGFINSFVTMANTIRGSTPVGVTMHGERFRARIGKGFGLSGYKSLGVFDTASEAHRAWQIEKLNMTNNYISEGYIYLARIANKLQFEINNNLETTSL